METLEELLETAEKSKISGDQILGYMGEFRVSSGILKISIEIFWRLLHVFRIIS